MNPTKPSAALEDNIVRLISLFEGSAGGAINVWDEQYLSFGALHFAVGQGSGVRLLSRIQQLDPHGFAACLGPQFAAAVQSGPASTVAFCKDQVWKSGIRWRNAFVLLARLDAYKQANRELTRPYLDQAQVVATRYGLTSERGLAFAMDRCVQQGAGVRKAVDSAYQQVKGGEEWAVMKALAVAYALSANPKYISVVKARAMTVALGSSAQTGYPGDVNVERDYGISPRRDWRTQ